MQVTITIATEFFFFVLEGGGARLAVPIKGDRASALANAVLMLPAVAAQLVGAGVKQLTLAGPASEGRLPASVWALLVPKADEELESARKEALRILEKAGVTIDSGVTIVGAEGLADALRAGEDPFAE